MHSYLLGGLHPGEAHDVIPYILFYTVCHSPVSRLTAHKLVEQAGLALHFPHVPYKPFCRFMRLLCIWRTDAQSDFLIYFNGERKSIVV